MRMKLGASPRHQPELKLNKIQRPQAQEKKRDDTEGHIPTTRLAKAMENPITLANQKQPTVIVYLL